MLSRVQEIGEDFRRDPRFQISYYATGEHRHLGKLILRIVNLSSTGALIDGKAGIERGDRISLHLPAAREIEALCLWTWHQQAGMGFDLPLSAAELESTFGAMAAAPRFAQMI